MLQVYETQKLIANARYLVDNGVEQKKARHSWRASSSSPRFMYNAVLRGDHSGVDTTGFAALEHEATEATEADEHHGPC